MNEFEKGDWILKKWYTKTMYIIGIIWSITFVLGFIYGFFVGLASY